MEPKELFEAYGRAMVELELAQNRVYDLKRQIAELINQPKQVITEKEDDPKTE